MDFQTVLTAPMYATGYFNTTVKHSESHQAQLPFLPLNIPRLNLIWAIIDKLMKWVTGINLNIVLEIEVATSLVRSHETDKSTRLSELWWELIWQCIIFTPLQSESNKVQGYVMDEYKSSCTSVNGCHHIVHQFDFSGHPLYESKTAGLVQVSLDSSGREFSR